MSHEVAKPGGAWTPEEDDLVRRQYPKQGKAFVWRRLGRSPDCVRARAIHLGIARPDLRPGQYHAPRIPAPDRIRPIDAAGLDRLYAGRRYDDIRLRGAARGSCQDGR